MTKMSYIGKRILETRELLGKTQTEFAEIAKSAGARGVTRQSQSEYEKGISTPSATYLSAIAEAGADVNYILTGERTAKGLVLEQTETLLINLFRKCSDEVKLHVLQNLMLVSSGSAASPKKESVVQKNTGDNSVQVGISSGDVNINSKTKKNK